LSAKQQAITCPHCKAEYPLARGLHERPLSEGLSDVGLLCPACQHFTHSYYETPAIAEQRAALLAKLELFQKTPAGKKREQRWVEYQTSKNAFGRMFAESQQRLKRKLGLKDEIQQNAPRQGSTDVL
jgi:hypothetical protein